MFELKRLSPEGTGLALAKAERYRLLNEPWDAESICLDILALEPDNQEALVTLLLAITDQFKMARGKRRLGDALELISRLQGEYPQAYYTGIIWERRATKILQRGDPGSGTVAYEDLRKAMEHYEEAERLRPAGDDSAIVRWNSCARIIERHDHVKPPSEDEVETMLE
jgi:tetratricopeptide (TPR) repeat protein